jgi:hypothetical protein
MVLQRTQLYKGFNTSQFGQSRFAGIEQITHSPLFTAMLQHSCNKFKIKNVSINWFVKSFSLSEVNSMFKNLRFTPKSGGLKYHVTVVVHSLTLAKGSPDLPSNCEELSVLWNRGP